MFFRFLVLIQVCTAFPLQCPEPAQWSIRARGLCPDPSKYSCLKNDLINGYSENCTISDFQAPGRKGVLRGGLDADICSLERYHPWPIKYYTNVSTNCIFLKSVCNEEGQVVYRHGNRNTDTTCRCDYTRGYAFIGKTRNLCYCVPSEEDCSCYLKTCIVKTYLLSPDYECINEKINTLIANCQTFTRKSVTKDRNDSNTTDTTILEHKQTTVHRKFYSRLIVIALCIGFTLVYCIYELRKKCTCKATTLFKMSQPIISHIIKEEYIEHQIVPVIAAYPDEDENFFRIFKLVTNVGTKAIRVQFDILFPPVNLQSELSNNEPQLKRLKSSHRLSPQQWDVLFPPSGGTVSSSDFDITLMICLIRNISSINKPINGFDNTPPLTEITAAADIARIKQFWNKLAHLDNNKITQSDFITYWTTLSDAIVRLGGSTMLEECDRIKDLKITGSVEIDNIVRELKQVVYNNELEENIRSDELIRITDVKFSFRKRLNIRENVSAREVKEELKAFLKIMNIDKKKGFYIVSFDKVFTFFVFYFASTRQMSKVLVEYADEKLLFDWFLVKKSLSEQFKFNISLPDEELFTCIQRVFTKMTNSEEFMRYILEGNNKTNINSFTAYVGKLNEKEIITIVGGSCIDFLIEICVVAEKDKQDHSDGELELYIVIPDDSILIYIKRIFDNLATSDCVEGCLRGNINTRNETFHSKLLIHMNELNRDEVERLIHKASSDFINRMLMISEDDIKPQSCWEYERYGIVIPEGLLQIYIERVFSDMTKTVYVTVNRNSENKKFLDNLHLYTNSLAEDKLASLIQNAGSKFISRMYLSSPGETTYTSLPRLDSSFIFVPKKYFKIFEQIILVQGNNWFLCSIFLIYDSTSCRIITQKYPECDLVLIKIHRKTGIERSKQKQHLMKYIDPLFTGKIIACGVNSTNDLVSKYIKRLLVDWNNGHVHDVFGNINLSNSSFLCEFITHLRNIDYERQSTLARTEDTNTRDLPLAVCSSVGILELAKWCLDNNADTNRGNAGFHPLYIACVQNHPDIVSLLLNHSSKADVNYSAGSSPQFSPLCAACACGYKTIVSLLIKEDVDVNCNSIERERPLYEACKNGYYEIVSLLLDKKSETIKINTSQKFPMFSCSGNTPLYIACTKGHTKIVSLLLNHTADEVDVNIKTEEGETPLYAACKCGYTDIVDLLLAHEIGVINESKIDGDSPLFIACQEGHVEVVSSLLKHNIIEIDQCMLIGMSPLFIASLLGHTEIVKMLLERKANAYICVKKKEMVTQIFNKNFGVFRQPETLDSAKYIKFLRKLVSNNATEHVKSYIEGKENDWVFNSILGASPLHMGSLMGHIEIVKLLVERNSNINSFSEKGSTPLILAYELGHTDIVQVLLANGADPF